MKCFGKFKISLAKEFGGIMYKQVQLAYFTIGNLDTEFYTHTHTQTSPEEQKQKEIYRYI